VNKKKRLAACAADKEFFGQTIAQHDKQLADKFITLYLYSYISLTSCNNENKNHFFSLSKIDHKETWNI